MSRSSGTATRRRGVIVTQGDKRAHLVRLHSIAIGSYRCHETNVMRYASFRYFAPPFNLHCRLRRLYCLLYSSLLPITYCLFDGNLPITSYCSQISIVHNCHNCHQYKFLPFVICEHLWQLPFVNNNRVILIYIPVRSAGDGLSAILFFNQQNTLKITSFLKPIPCVPCIPWFGDSPTEEFRFIFHCRPRGRFQRWSGQ